MFNGTLSTHVEKQPDYLLVIASVYMFLVCNYLLAKVCAFKSFVRKRRPKHALCQLQTSYARSAWEQLVRWYRETHQLIEDHAIASDDDATAENENGANGGEPLPASSSRTPSVSSESSVLDLSEAILDPEELSDCDEQGLKAVTLAEEAFEEESNGKQEDNKER